MLSFLAKKDKIKKTSTFICQKGSTKILDLLCKTYHANDRDNNMSLFTSSSRQLRRITEQCWKCPRTATPSSTCHSYHQKQKHIMVNMRSTQPKKNIWHFFCQTQHSTRSVYLEWTSNCSSSFKKKGTFHFRQKNTFHSQHKK